MICVCDICSYQEAFTAPQWAALNGWQILDGYLTLCPEHNKKYGKDAAGEKKA